MSLWMRRPVSTLTGRYSASFSLSVYVCAKCMYAHLCHLHECVYEFVYVCVFHAHVGMPVCKLCKLCFYTLHLCVVIIVLVECFSLCWKVI